MRRSFILPLFLGLLLSPQLVNAATWEVGKSYTYKTSYKKSAPDAKSAYSAQLTLTPTKAEAANFVFTAKIDNLTVESALPAPAEGSKLSPELQYWEREIGELKKFTSREIPLKFNGRTIEVIRAAPAAVSLDDVLNKAKSTPTPTGPQNVGNLNLFETLTKMASDMVVELYIQELVQAVVQPHKPAKKGESGKKIERRLRLLNNQMRDEKLTYNPGAAKPDCRELKFSATAISNSKEKISGSVCLHKTGDHVQRFQSLQSLGKQQKSIELTRTN